jgi:hypothetical protein
LITTAPLAALRCAGTEADNPVLEQPAEATQCKGEEEYTALRRDVATVGGQQAPSSGSRFAQHGLALSTSSEIPVWLECVDWTLGESGELTVQVFNFGGACGVSWEGHGLVDENGTLRLELENANPGCAYAGCGNCTYDARTTFLLDDPTAIDIPFTLARLPCEPLDGQDSEWQLPLAEQSSGTRCVLAEPDGAAKASSNDAGRSDALFAACTLVALDVVPFPRPLTDCGDSLECVEQRCVPACDDDSDCPLQGALSCQEGFCQLAP